MPSRELTPRSLRADERGAVMVVAVFMAAFLVGGLWYVIGIGDAILFRERMQEGADAVAFSAAVYHARGMNLIAMINLIMAAVLGVLVAVKLVQVINVIANVVSCALSAASLGTCAPCDAVCGITSDLESPIADAVNAVEKVVKATLPVLSKIQVGIALGMPWVAEGKSYLVSKSYAKPVEGGATLGTSLVPYHPEKKLGLPVQEGNYSDLCKKAGEVVGEVAFKPFGSFGTWVGGVIGSIVSTFPGYFCAGGSVNIKDAAKTDVLSSLVDQNCTKQKESKSGDEKKKFDMGKCKKDETKKLQDDLKKKGSMMAGSNLDTSGMTHKVVFSGAENGNMYFQIWSLVMGEDAWNQRAQKGVEIAAWNKAKGNAPPIWGRVGFAQAEFYYAPKSDQRGAAWSDYKDDTMWNLRWRARMRRVRLPVEDAVGALVEKVGDKLFDKVNDKLKTVLADKSALEWLGGSVLSGAAKKDMKALFKDVGDKGGSIAEDAVLDSTDGYAVIH